MDIPINATVYCLDGICGRSTHLIIKPTTEQITHLVVANGTFPETKYLVTIDHIVESTPQWVRLNCTRDDLLKMPIFNQVEFIPSDLAGFAGSDFMMWPYVAPEAPYIVLEKECIPADELAIRRGANVEATDGRVGRVDEFMINPADDAISHLVLREGHLWGQKDVTIPVSQIDHIEEDTVFLKLDKHSIEALPAIPIRRGRTNKA